jgi:peptidoglycan/xylan/chitin deacetylase (PgdA/CDA1 family)
VRAQIRASRNAGVDEFILWDAAVTYTADALDGTAKLPALELTSAPPKDAPMPVRLPELEQQRSTEAPGAVKRPLSGLPPNEIGRIPVVMHHQIRPDRVGEYDQTPKEFRAELELLWKRGYAPIAVSDLIDGRIDIPAGTSPVVLTFDDATTEQLALRPDGTPKPDTAVGILLEFARTHPGFEPAGTFYVNREPFGSADAGRRLLPWLVEHGFELGNHTHDHTPLRGLSATEVQRELVRGAGVIHAALPGYRIRSLALPMGSLPDDARLAVRGSWDGRGYGPYGVLLVGAQPAASPYSTDFDPGAIPRIRTSHAGWKGEADFAFAYWMTELARNPRTRYVSDGDPDTIAVREDELARVKPRFRSRVAP